MFYLVIFVNMKGKKTGGRTKGSRNLMSVNQTENVSDFLRKYRDGQIADDEGTPLSLETDFAAMTPTDRVVVYARLQALITPKPIDVGVALNSHITIEDQLSILAEENDF